MVVIRIRSNQNSQMGKLQKVPQRRSRATRSAHIATPTTNERPGPQNQRQNLNPQSAETATW